MGPSLFARLFAAVLIITLPVAVEACSRSVLKAATTNVVPTGKINQELLNESVRLEVNYHRCRAGLTAVENAGAGISKEALRHSRWMAESRSLSHQNTIRGRATLAERFKASGVRFRTGSENIGYVHRFQIDSKRIQVVDAAQCKFQAPNGQTLPAHTYATLARQIVNLWMNSPGHRKNILDQRATRVSTAVAFDPEAKFCGQFWLTQNFVG